MRVQQKILYSVVASSLFAAVSLPSIYHYTNGFFGTGGDSCPTPLTRLIHCGVYLILQYLILQAFNMRKPEADRHTNKQLFMWSIHGTLLYHLVSDSDMYMLSQSVLGQMGGVNIADGSGCPNLMGLGVHSVVYFLALWCLMTMSEDAEKFAQLA